MTAQNINDSFDERTQLEGALKRIRIATNNSNLTDAGKLEKITKELSTIKALLDRS